MDGAAFRIAGLSFLNPNRDRLFDSIRELAVSPQHQWMRTWLDHLCGALEQPGLEREHARLFGANPICPPWQGPADQAGNSPIRDDHVGLLLISFAMLLETNAPPLDLLRFWTDHLEWVPDFCRTVERRSTHPYFTSLAAWIADGLLRPAMSNPPPLPVTPGQLQRLAVS